MDGNRYDIGGQVLNRVTMADGKSVIEGLRATSPDLGRFIVEFAYGDVISRGGISIKMRELSTIAVLGAIGGCEPQLRVHIQGSLNVGCTKEEIIETLLQLCVYCGFPKAINAMNCAKEVFEKN